MEPVKETIQQDKSGMNECRIPQIIIFPALFLYFELVFRILIYKNIGTGLIYAIIFAIPVGILAGIISQIFTNTINQIISSVIMIFIAILFCAQLIYYKVFHVFLSVYSIFNGGGQALDFVDVIKSTMVSNIFGLILFIVPPILLIIFRKKLLQFSRPRWSVVGSETVTAVVLYIVCVLLLRVGGTNVNSAYDLFHNTNSTQLSMERLGMLTSMRLDAKYLLVGGDKAITSGLDIGAEQMKDDEVTLSEADSTNDNETTNGETETVVEEETTTEKSIDTSPNVMNIDFDKLAENEDNETIKSLHKYFASVTPTNKNEYTGMFKNYNLIYITAEGFSKYAVDKEITPTLYKLVNQGFVLNNYYNPIWGVSTSDGEYVTCLGLIPESGTWSFEKSGELGDYFPFDFANQFKKLGANPMAYHDHSYTYYGRDISHPNMGYTFKAYNHGLDVDYTWPESDLQMMKLSVDDYINDDIFHAYYMTVSGHLTYTFEGNYIAKKNQNAVKNMDAPENVKAYMACNVELDKAMEYLLKRLKKAGKLENTLIVLNGDHYPYGLVDESFEGAKEGTLNKLAGKNIEGTLEMYRSTAIIYSGSMTEPVEVDKYCSSLDLVPTVSNLLGLKYDSRLLVGKDIMSDSNPLLIFNDRSFITDKCKYNAMTGEITKLTDKNVSDKYIENINKIVNNKFSVSASILDNNYYSYVIKKKE